MTCDMEKKVFIRVSVHSILRGPLVEKFFWNETFFQPVFAASCDLWHLPKCSVHKGLWPVTWTLGRNSTVHVFLISVSSDACQEHQLTLVKNLGSFYNHTGYLFIHTNDKFLSSEKIFMCSKMQNIEGRGQERDREPCVHHYYDDHNCCRHVARIGRNLPVTCLWQPFASLVLLPRTSVIARGRQFFVNKSEKFKVSVKLGVECKYKIWAANVLIYRL